MPGRLLTGLAVVAMFAAGCGAATKPDNAGQPLAAPTVVMARPPANLDLAGLAGGNRRLGYDLGRALAAHADRGNLVYSPASLAIAFAMLREGAGGDTATTIDRVLHLGGDRHAAYNALVTALRTPGAGNVLDVGNGLFIDPGLTVRRGYLTAIKRWYGAGLVQTPFPEPALDVINTYVDTNTHGRIPHLLDDLDPAAVFALVNTVYLNARWQHAFDRNDTYTGDFHATADRTVQVHLMHSTADIDYAGGRGWQAVRLPYHGDRLSMWVLLPKTGGDPLDLLAPGVLARAADGFDSDLVSLTLPRWDLDNKFDLTETLQAMGLDIFDGGDFRGITADPSFEITQVIQQANITVGEKGTVAAAATAIIGEAQGLVVPDRPIIFDADHPFAFAIMDNITGTPLFEGTVSDPS